MTRLQKIKSIIASVFMLLFGIVFLIDPEDGYAVVVTILGLLLIGYGINTLVYFFTMTRFMVGGKFYLYKGVILLDLGFLSISLNDIPRYYVLIYLIVVHAFTGLVKILKAIENKQIGTSYRLKLTTGIIEILFVLACIIFIKKTNTAVLIYGLGLVYSSLLRLIQVSRNPNKKMAS